MRTITSVKPLAFYFFIAIITIPAWAYWTNPIFLAELNDYENSYPASRPSISADENTLFFVRYNSLGQHRTWQAQRNPETGIFDQPRILSELENSGKTFGIWMSEDNLRLYYAAAEYVNGNLVRPIWMASRQNVNETWHTIKRFNELHIATLLASCSLTADEKYIMFHGGPYTTPRQPKIYFAKRNSIEESFSSPREAYELNAIGANAPAISPDGLTVYFFISVDGSDGVQEPWTAHRESIDEPFSNFTRLDDIISFGDSMMGWCSPSWDGQRLYYLQRHGEPGNWNIEATGIFVAHWVDPPEVLVDKNLMTLIDQKTSIADELAVAIEMEIETLEILNSLQAMTEDESDAYWAINKTICHTNKALKDEILAQGKIQSSINELEKALSVYRMEESSKHKANK